MALLCAGALPATAQVDQERAAAWFAEAEALCEREGGRLWGVSLCGPMVFADPATGTIATNEPAPEADRPRVLGYANAALEWGDRRWSTFVWPMIPEEPSARARLLLHELFHRVQPELGLYVPVAEGENDHLDTPEGRTWLQLEWRALAAALESSGAARTEAMADALAFRKARRERFPGAAERERIAEINEGLAQYTATVAAAAYAAHAEGETREGASSEGDSREEDEAVANSAIRQLAEAAQKESFVRTFAYASGAAYGILLDDYSPGWTRRMRASDDLGRLLKQASGVRPSRSADRAAARYGGTELQAAEERREAERQARVAELRARFVEGPVLVAPRGRNASFITTGVTPIPGAGTIYPSFRVTGPWGSIQAERVLMSPDGTTLTVPAPFTREGAVLVGDGWTVTLAEGWTVRPGPRKGDFRVVPAES